MAFPQVVDRVTSEEGGSANIHTIDLPATINPGDLLVAFYGDWDSADVAPPDGWEVFLVDRSVNSNLILGMYRLADGTEGASITLETLTAIESSHVVYRITGAADPANQEPEGTTFVPLNWHLRVAHDQFRTNMSIASKEVEAATIDPDPFTYEGSEDWTSMTVAVPPSGTDFPVVAETSLSAVDSSTATNHTVDLPDSISNGDLLIGFFTCARDNADDVTWPAGWTEFGIVGTQAGGGNRLSVAWRAADGTEGASITVTTASGGESTHTVLRVTGAADPTTTPPEVSTANGVSATPDPPSLTFSGGSDKHLWIATVSAAEDWGGSVATGSSTSPDPPSLTPNGGAKDYLWLAAAEHRGGSVATAAPTDYTNLQSIADFRTAIGTAERELNAASEDPGVFTYDNSTDWVAATAVIHPAPSGGLSVSLGTVSFNFDLGDALGVLRELVPATFDLAPQALAVEQQIAVALGTVEFSLSPQTLNPGVGAGQTIPLGVVAFNLSPQDIAWQRLRDLGVVQFPFSARPLGVSGGESVGGAGSTTGITHITDIGTI